MRLPPTIRRRALVLGLDKLAALAEPDAAGRLSGPVLDVIAFADLLDGDGDGADDDRLTLDWWERGGPLGEAERRAEWREIGFDLLRQGKIRAFVAYGWGLQVIEASSSDLGALQ